MGTAVPIGVLIVIGIKVVGVLALRRRLPRAVKSRFI